MGKVGDVAFKVFSAGLGVATIYLTATFSVNVYRGYSWHRAQSFCFQSHLMLLLVLIRLLGESILTLIVSLNF
ncbi:hypothetical protein AMTRI_Chr10g229860 [Amborella trichopoda]